MKTKNKPHIHVFYHLVHAFVYLRKCVNVIGVKRWDGEVKSTWAQVMLRSSTPSRLLGDPEILVLGPPGECAKSVLC